MTSTEGDEPNSGVATGAVRSRQLRAVAALGRLACEATLDAVMVEAVRVVRTTLDTDCCGVFDRQLAAEGPDGLDGDKLRLGWGVGWPPETVGVRTVSAASNTLAGETLRSATPVVVADYATDARFDRSRLLVDHEITSAIAVGIHSYDDSWGVLGTYSTAERQFSESDTDFLEAVSTTLAAAIDRRNYSAERERQRAEGVATERIAALGHAMTGALIDSMSVSELEALVCERLVGDRYPTALIAHLRPRREAVMLRAIAGVTDGYEAAVGEISAAEIRVGIGNAVRKTGVAQIITEIQDDPRLPDSLGTWGRDHGMRSLIAVPICHRSVCYGMLLVWSTAAGGFTPREKRLLTAVGETVGSVTHAINSQQFAAADRVVELSFETTDTESSPFETELDACTVRLDGVIQQADNTVFCYLSLTAGDPDRLVAAAAADDRIRSARQLATMPEYSLLELVFEDSTVLATVTSVGGEITQASCEGKRSRLGAVFPPTVDVRWVVETVQKYHPKWKLAAKAYRDKPDQTGLDTRLQTARGHLTDRQATVLETAYRGGYFEWPRHSTAEEIAASLDIAPPTFHKHMRTCQQKLVGSLFERLSAE